LTILGISLVVFFVCHSHHHDWRECYFLCYDDGVPFSTGRLKKSSSVERKVSWQIAKGLETLAKGLATQEA